MHTPVTFAEATLTFPQYHLSSLGQSLLDHLGECFPNYAEKNNAPKIITIANDPFLCSRMVNCFTQSSGTYEPDVSTIAQPFPPCFNSSAKISSSPWDCLFFIITRAGLISPSQGSEERNSLVLGSGSETGAVSRTEFKMLSAISADTLLTCVKCSRHLSNLSATLCSLLLLLAQNNNRLQKYTYRLKSILFSNFMSFSSEPPCPIASQQPHAISQPPLPFPPTKFHGPAHF